MRPCITEHFEKVKNFLDDLDSEDVKSIKKAKLAIREPTLKKNLAFIKSNFECLVIGVTKLQGQGMALATALEIVESVRTRLQSMRGRTEFVKKFDRVIARNAGFLQMKEIAAILTTGKATQQDEFIATLSPKEISSFMYAPITSCDVERTFSKHKQVLGEKLAVFIE